MFFYAVAFMCRITCFVCQVDVLTPGGNGVPVTPKQELTVEQLQLNRATSNTSVIERMRTDVYADELWQACIKDAKAGRMTQPVPLQFEHLADRHLSPRFGVAQGTL